MEPFIKREGKGSWLDGWYCNTYVEKALRKRERVCVIIEPHYELQSQLSSEIPDFVMPEYDTEKTHVRGISYHFLDLTASLLPNHHSKYGLSLKMLDSKDT